MNSEYEYDLKMVKSPVPYITTGVFWIIYALIFPLYAWYHILIAASSSVVVYKLSSRIFPAKQVKVRRQHRIDLSGDRDADNLIKTARSTMNRIEAHAGIIETENETLSNDTRMLIDSGYKILEHVSKYPESARLVRRFFNYYLPTLDKLLDSYVEFTKHNTAKETVQEIEETVPKMKDVFQKQIDKLLSDRELDISSDIAVLENKLDSLETRNQ